MKKLFYLFVIVGLVATSCKKPADVPTSQDVVFKATPAATGNFKDGEVDCVNPMAHYALIDIDGTILTVDVFYLAGVIYTNTIKLAPGPHTVNSFVLMNDDGTPADTSDDDVVQATPLVDSEYANFVEQTLPFDFTVDAFFKLEINIEILCFVPNKYESFGFVWFTVEEVLVREVCFFGDFCTKYFEDYGQSLYANQTKGLRHDMPAIFQIEVWRNGEWVITYDNETRINDAGERVPFLGEGFPLCIKYPDFKGVVDNFEFVLKILVKVGDDFAYVPFHTFTSVDDAKLEGIGDDNVMDFVLGSCVVDADLILAPYINLPETVTLTVGSTMAPGTEGTALDATLTGIPAGYDLMDDTYGAYFLEYDGYVGPGWTYPDMKLFSSLYPALIISPFVNGLDNLNWLMNNLYRYPAYTSQDIQNAIWVINGINPAWWGTPSPNALQMAADALNFGDGYLPPVGGYAAVVLDPNSSNTSWDWVLLFIVVDP